MTDCMYRELSASEVAVAREMRASMVRELNGHDPDVTNPGWRERYEAFYCDKISRGLAALFVAEVDDKPVGVAGVYLLKNHRSDIFGFQSAYVSNVWVQPDQRKRGIASALTRMTIEWSRAKGCEVVRLRSSAMARSVYGAIGFRPSEEMELHLDY